MRYNDYMYAVDRSDEYLAHYGIKGMKWGVQRAVQRGDSKAYTKHYNKALKKLAKLERQATSGGKYARRATLLTGAAGITGSIAFKGASGIASGIRNRATKRAEALKDKGKIAEAEIGLNSNLKRADQIDKWASKTPYADKSKDRADTIRARAKWDVEGREVRVPSGTDMFGNSTSKREIQQGKYSSLSDEAKADYLSRENARADAIEKRGKTLTNDKMFKAGAALTTAGLLGAAGYNAYRAATTNRAARKAEEWRREIDKTFGTSYSKKKRK